MRENATAALRHLGCREAAAATGTTIGVINPERKGCAGAQSVLKAVDAVANADKVLQAVSSALGLCEQRASTAAPRGSGSGTPDTLACAAEASAKDRAAAALSDAEASLAAVSLAPQAKPAPGQGPSTRGPGTNTNNTGTGGKGGGGGGIVVGAVVAVLFALVVIVVATRRAFASKSSGAGPALQPEWDRKPMAKLRAASSSTMTTLNPAYELAVANNPSYVEGSGAAKLPQYAEVADIADASAPNAGARPYENPMRQADVPAYQVPSNDAVPYGTRTLWRRPPNPGDYRSVPTKASAGRGAPALGPALGPARLLAKHHLAAAESAPGHKARPRDGSATLYLDDRLASEI